MIRYKKVKNTHVFTMNDHEMRCVSELIWGLKHTPPAIGFNRKKTTLKQQEAIDKLFELINYPPDYNIYMNIHYGQ